MRQGRRASSGTSTPAASTREAVLDAALATFTEHTYGGTSMAQVAERAGVAVGSIYRHFPSKEALGNAVYLRWKRGVLEQVMRDVDRDAPVRVAFGQLWRALTTFAFEQPEAQAFLEHQQHGEYLDEQNRRVANEVVDVAMELIIRGQETGEIRPTHPGVLMALAYGAFVGLSKALRDGPPLPADQVAEAEEAVWEMLRA